MSGVLAKNDSSHKYDNVGMIIGDPICVVGMACHLPGGIASPVDLWHFLINERSAQGTVPKIRFNMEGFYDQNGKSRAGVLDAAGGYFLSEDVRQFENSFFGINNLEATSMDPQQRKLLEVVFECFEHAGVSLEHVSGSSTGVYVGNFTVDHQTMQTRDPDSIHRYTATGCGTTILANRISHVFNLQGPSFTLDTACSSSISCLHSAVTAIQAGDCDSAIVAGVNLVMAPEQCLGTSKAGVLSPTSTCHTFDASADGYGRAEGINAVYLKRYADALENGDKIWAIVRGTAVNANGKTPGITQPSADLQEAVIRKAYFNANLDFSETDYVECHGTGTPVGDPIEVEAISRCFSRQQGGPLMIGSSKPNLGHSEAASGLTALIKVILALEYGKIPPTYGVTNLNPKLHLQARGLQVVTRTQEWPRALRRASLNAFGYGGANAHAIIESASSYHDFTEKALKLSLGWKDEHNGFSVVNRAANEVSGTERSTATGAVKANGTNATEHGDTRNNTELFVLPISAASAKALKTRVEQVQRLIQDQLGDANAVRSLAWTLAERRSHFNVRQVLLTRTGPDGQPQTMEGLESAGHASPICFVFTGQGAQYATMAKELLQQNEHFLRTIRNLDDVLQTLPREQAPDWTLEQTILDPPDTSQVNHVTKSQPICTAIQIALVDLLRAWGVEPSGGVVGHSSGEIAAAYAGGLLTATQAILVAYFRGYAVGKLQTKGAMLAAALSVEDAEIILQEKGLTGEVCVACVNSPGNVTLSGSLRGIDLLMTEIEGPRKGFARKLQTGGQAYHSHMMQFIGALYEDLLYPFFGDGDEPRPTADEGNVKRRTYDMFSSVGVYGEELAVLDNSVNWPKYWRKNLETPVQFCSAIERLATSRETLHLVEVGPHPALKGPIEQIRQHMRRDEHLLRYACTLVRQKDAEVCIKQLAGTLYLHGHDLNWRHINFQSSPKHRQPTAHFAGLPPYPWDYAAGLLWQEPRLSAELRSRSHPRHELLGSQQAAGNGIKTSWRNVLDLDEVPWLRDHRLESQIVFPATGYLAAAMEALTQIRRQNQPAGINYSFHFRNVSFHAALVIPDSDRGDKVELELHTTMSARELSTTTASSDWYDFSISSWVAGTATTHCVGSLCAHETSGHVDRNTGAMGLNIDRVNGFDEWPNVGRWYGKFEQEGLSFGPWFQSVASLKTDGDRLRCETICSTCLTPRLIEETKARGTSTYPVHPIVMDACLQAAIMSATAGDVNALRVFLPVFIDQCQVRPPTSQGSQDIATIHSRAIETGVSTQRIDSTLFDSRGTSIVNFHQVRMSQYIAKTAPEPSISRQPCLRVQWKPDIQQIGVNATEPLTKYIASFVKKQQDDEAEVADDERVAIIGVLLDLLGHKNPRMRVLELGTNCDCKTNLLLDHLGKGTGFQRCRSWHKGKIDGHGSLSHDSKDECAFDVVLIPTRTASRDYWDRAPKTLISFVAQMGAVVTFKTKAAMEALTKARFTVLEISKQIVFAIRPYKLQVEEGPEGHALPLGGKNVILVTPDNPASAAETAFVDVLACYLRQDTGAANVKVAKFGAEVSQVQSWKDVVCICLLELEHAFLTTMSQQHMDLLRRITNDVPTLLWLTGAGMLGGCPNPSLTLSNGLSRALMLEQPSLSFLVLDVGSPQIILSGSRSDMWNTCHNITKIIESAINNIHDDLVDKEFIQQDRLLQISRFSPDFELNAIFQRKHLSFGAHWASASASAVHCQEMTLKSARPARLKIGRVGMSDTIHFQQVREPLKSPPAGFIDVLVRAVSLNAKDVYALNGRVETRGATTALEFSGVVTAAGPDIMHLQKGDAVVVLAPCHFSTTERVPAWAAHKLLRGEKHTTLATLPVIYATALYALRERGHLRAGESVLIHAGAGAFGLAAITIAQQIGATVYTTASSAKKRAFVTTQLGLSDDHIFQSRDTSFVAGVKSATGGRGVDLVVNSLVGDLMHASWGCVAPFGRFVEIGKRELVDAGKLDMHVFLRSATFTAFDLSDLFFHEDNFHRDLLRSLVTEVLQLYRSGQINPVPATIFPVAEIVQAYRYFSSKDRVGKVVVSLENDEARILVSPSRYSKLFDPKKVYLLAGCLGGLGRSLSRWMLARGARNLVFIGRSGCDKTSAKDLISRLETAGASVTVIRGDISIATDVSKAVAACEATGKPIGGIVQAAMGLHEGLFSRMTSEAWHTGIQPKWSGTLNLHQALEGHDSSLEFFLLMSSVSGSVGTATESNYCAANGFLDSFARYRRTQGKPAVSVGLGMISEVGYLHENPEIEALLLRRGIQPLNEAEFLQVIDLALAGGEVCGQYQDTPWSAHILTGLEPFGARHLMDLGFNVSHGALDDPRAAVISAALEAEHLDMSDRGRRGKGAADPGRPSIIAAWFKTLPTKAAESLAWEADAPSLQAAVLQLIRKRFSHLILLPIDQISDDKPLAKFGVDSMIASEFRSWFWTTLRVDVPFLDLLSAEKTLSSVSGTVVDKILDINQV